MIANILVIISRFVFFFCQKICSFLIIVITHWMVVWIGDFEIKFAFVLYHMKQQASRFPFCILSRLLIWNFLSPTGDSNILHVSTNACTCHKSHTIVILVHLQIHSTCKEKQFFYSFSNKKLSFIFLTSLYKLCKKQTKV